MPIEYLEKIFQIPLTLPAMEPPAYGRLIASLAPNVEAPEPDISQSRAATRRAVTEETVGGARAPTRAMLTVQPGSAASGVGDNTIDLTRSEIAFAQQLGGLVHTPRAAKRLMNTYRFIRATQHVGSRSRFLGSDGKPGEYFAVLSLLAIAAGYPTLADRVLVALEEDAAEHNISTWNSFVLALKPRKDEKDGAGALYPAGLGSTSAQGAEWANLYAGLEQSLQTNRLAALDAYLKWGRTAARFSFTL